MNEWMNHPDLSGIAPEKLAMLQSLASQSSQKGKNELLPFLMAVSGNSKKNGMQFSPQEISTIVEVLKSGKSSEEIARIDRIISLMKMMKF